MRRKSNRKGRTLSQQEPHTAYVVHDWKLASYLSNHIDRRQAIIVPVPSYPMCGPLNRVIFVDAPPVRIMESPELSAKYEAFCQYMQTRLAPGGQIVLPTV